MTVAQLRIRPDNYPDVELVLDLGSVAPSNSDGTAVWAEKEAKRRRNYVEYTGESILKLTLSVMLDQFPNGNVEGTIQRIMGLSARNDKPEPSVLRLAGPIPYSSLPYILSKVEEIPDLVERRDDGNRCRSELKLTFWEYNPPRLIIQGPPPSPAAAAQQRQSPSTPAVGAAVQAVLGATSRTYTVRRGDTLSAIAARELKNVGRWPEIAKLNAIRDPNRISVGQVLKLP